MSIVILLSQDAGRHIFSPHKKHDNIILYIIINTNETDGLHCANVATAFCREYIL